MNDSENMYKQNEVGVTNNVLFVLVISYIVEIMENNMCLCKTVEAKDLGH